MNVYIVFEDSCSLWFKVVICDSYGVLDKCIMVGDIFVDCSNFVCFLCVQYCFYCSIDVLYVNFVLDVLLFDFGGCWCLIQVVCDLQDLEQILFGVDIDVLFLDFVLFIVLGWLYVVEGFNFGGIILYKMVVMFGLYCDFGVCYLVVYFDGVVCYWCEFIVVLDVVLLSGEQEQQVIDVVDVVFCSVYGYVEVEFV